MGEHLKMVTHSINNRGSQLAATLPFVNKAWCISFLTVQWRYLRHMKKGPLLRFRNWYVRANHLPKLTYKPRLAKARTHSQVRRKEGF